MTTPTVKDIAEQIRNAALSPEQLEELRQEIETIPGATRSFVMVTEAEVRTWLEDMGALGEGQSLSSAEIGSILAEASLGETEWSQAYDAASGSVVEAFRTLYPEKVAESDSCEPE